MKKSKKNQIVFIFIGTVLLIFACALTIYKFWKPTNINVENESLTIETPVEIYSSFETLTENENETELSKETTTQKRITKSKKITSLKNELKVDKEVPDKPVMVKPKPKPAKPNPKPIPNPSVILNVPTILQYPKYPTGCEAASATSLMQYYKVNVSMDEMINAIPKEELYEENGKVYGPNINEKFAGNPMHKSSSDCPGFGAYSPVIERAMNNVLASKLSLYRAKRITGCSFKSLLSNLKRNNPVIVWSTYKMKAPGYKNSWWVKNPDGTETQFKYPTMMHIMVLYGYDSSKVYIMDPILGNVSYSRSLFEQRWNELGKQAIIMEKIIPLPTKPETTTDSSESNTTEISPSNTETESDTLNNTTETETFTDIGTTVNN